MVGIGSGAMTCSFIGKLKMAPHSSLLRGRLCGLCLAFLLRDLCLVLFHKQLNAVAIRSYLTVAMLSS